MELLEPRNGDVVKLLATLDTPQLVRGVTDAVRVALGIPAGMSLSDAPLPIYGVWHRLDMAAASLEIYALTARRLIRYELGAAGASLTVTVPLDRVSRVSDISTPAGLQVEIEQDAYHQQITAAVVLPPAADGPPAAPASRTEMSGQIRRAGYTLVATLGPNQEVDDVIRLAEFSRALRILLDAV